MFAKIFSGDESRDAISLRYLEDVCKASTKAANARVKNAIWLHATMRRSSRRKIERNEKCSIT